MSAQITLVCCTCGESREAVVAHFPKFGFELYDPAKAVGFLHSFDLENCRALIFCSAECRQVQITKGRFRKRLITKPARPVAANNPQETT